VFPDPRPALRSDLGYRISPPWGSTDVEAASSMSSQPSLAATVQGIGLAGRDTLFHRENSSVLPLTNVQREAAVGVPSRPGVAALEIDLLGVLVPLW
jgi:hypothetical protein